MAIFSKVPIGTFSIWKKKYRKMKEETKIVYFFLFTSEISGIFEIPRLEKTGVSDVDGALKELENNDLIKIDRDNEIIVIPEMFKVGVPKGPKQIAGVLKYFKTIDEDFTLWNEVLSILVGYSYPSEVIDFIKSMQGVSIQYSVKNETLSIDNKEDDNTLSDKETSDTIEFLDSMDSEPKKKNTIARIDPLDAKEIVEKYVSLAKQENPAFNIGRKLDAIKLVGSGSRYGTEALLKTYKKDDLLRAVINYFSKSEKYRFKVNNFFGRKEFEIYLNESFLEENGIVKKEIFTETDRLGKVIVKSGHLDLFKQFLKELSKTKERSSYANTILEYENLKDVMLDIDNEGKMIFQKLGMVIKWFTGHRGYLLKNGIDTIKYKEVLDETKISI